MEKVDLKMEIMDMMMEIQMKTLKKILDHRKAPRKLLILMRTLRSKMAQREVQMNQILKKVQMKTQMKIQMNPLIKVQMKPLRKAQRTNPRENLMRKAQKTNLRKAQGTTLRKVQRKNLREALMRTLTRNLKERETLKK